ncbi:MAG: hypothetical protein CVU61_02860 [Deltaproteobacteria bacterium HGW-Deltaproteobacteria-19]|nr:MAG: hypothetical protein CVU61_02860 [Deltaproteobacteria bacterium HGW-Deltaproteobacteria-19]
MAGRAWSSGTSSVNAWGPASRCRGGGISGRGRGRFAFRTGVRSPGHGRSGKKEGAMILYAVADIHGRKENLERIERIARERKPDVLVAAGDVATRRDAAFVLERLDALSIPVLVVRGNMDPPGFDREAGT